MIKVLIADDEKRICELIQILGDWKGHGMELSGTAENGPAALEKIAMSPPDILITDIRMPGLTGLELIREAKKLSPALKTVIISGYADFDYAKTAIEEGVFAYLLKPIQRQELNEVLEKLKLLIGGGGEEERKEESERAGESEKEKAHHAVRLARRYIRIHFQEQITLESVSESVGLTSSYFSNLFKKEMGIGFARYLINVRMDEAKELLRETNLSVAEICRRVGYNDAKHFSHIFEETSGMRPSVYRASAAGSRELL